MNTPQISIVMPVYNTGKYLEECIKSVFDQTFKDFELVCVDDASKDTLTLQILEKYQGIYPNMKVLHLKHNAGAGEARNIGFKEAVGEYVIFLDADDIFSKDLLEKMYESIEEKNADVCICGFKRFYLQDDKKCFLSEWKPRVSKIEDTTDERHLIRVSAVPWNKLCRRKFLLDHNIYFQTLSSSNDMFFSIMLMKETNVRSYITDTGLVEHRVNTPTQISANRNSCNLFYAVNQIEKTLKQKNLHDETAQKQIMLLLITSGLVEMRRCKSEDMNRECYSLIKDYLNANKLLSDNKVLNVLYWNFINKPYESRWFETEYDFYRQLKLFSEELKKVIVNKKNILLWGLGERGKAFEKFCMDEGINIFGVADGKNINVGGYTEYGNKIFSTDSTFETVDLIIASNEDIYNFLKHKLNTMEIVDLEKYCPI